MSTELPAVPLTLEGLSVLHQMFRFRWAEWRRLGERRQSEIMREVGAASPGKRGSRAERHLFDAGP